MELGKLVFLPLVLFTITALVWVMTASFIGLLGLVSGMATGLVISLVWILYEKRGRKLLFGKESAEIKRLKDNLKQLYRKSSAQFEKEKKDLIGRITSELGHFELAFEHITKNTNSDLRSLEAEHSFGLISDKDYVKKEKRLKQLYINAKTLLSTIQS